MDKKKIGERMTELREKAGQSKRFVAKKTGCSYSSICSYEYGLRIPSDETKQKLADHFGVPVGYLFFEE